MSAPNACCGAVGAYESLCNDCGDELCEKCAAFWDAEGGYGEGGRDVRISSYCDQCWGEREYKRQLREQRNDSGV